MDNGESKPARTASPGPFRRRRSISSAHEPANHLQFHCSERTGPQAFVAKLKTKEFDWFIRILLANFTADFTPASAIDIVARRLKAELRTPSRFFAGGGFEDGLAADFTRRVPMPQPVDNIQQG